MWCAAGQSFRCTAASQRKTDERGGLVVLAGAPADEALKANTWNGVRGALTVRE